MKEKRYERKHNVIYIYIYIYRNLKGNRFLISSRFLYLSVYNIIFITSFSVIISFIGKK